jgi:RNA polymerase sigma-70 factor (ECF subfamily)
MSTVERERAAQFSATYAALYGRVHAYAARRVGMEAADEVTAETFLVAWRRFDVIPREPLPWLYGVARNVVLRHRVAHARQEAALHAMEADWVAAEPIDSDDVGLWAAWLRLSTSDREVLALVAWEELPVRDAARSLGCSAPVFSVRLHRARRRFERLLERPVAAARATSNPSEVS